MAKEIMSWDIKEEKNDEESVDSSDVTLNCTAVHTDDMPLLLKQEVLSIEISSLTDDFEFSEELFYEFNPDIEEQEIVGDCNNNDSINEASSEVEEANDTDSTTSQEEPQEDKFDPCFEVPRRRRRLSDATADERRLLCNERERMRMHSLNEAFQELQKVIPYVIRDNKRVTKKDILKMAVSFIKGLFNKVLISYGYNEMYTFSEADDLVDPNALYRQCFKPQSGKNWEPIPMPLGMLHLSWPPITAPKPTRAERAQKRSKNTIYEYE